MKNITVSLIEATQATICVCSISNDGAIEILSREAWSPIQYLIDTNGQRLIEEISRRVNAHWKKFKSKSDCIALSLPGTLRGKVAVISSSRLGIKEPVEFSKILGKLLDTPCYLFHDVECLVTGEIKHGNHFPDQTPPSLVYIFVDEGIGSSIFIEGKRYLGMGTAGLLGRLIVQPEGAYISELRSIGSLEAYASRPWVSRRLVEVYSSEIKKKDPDLALEDMEHSKFRQALHTAYDNNDWSQIPYDRIASGLKDSDPIALHVIDYAAKYLGFAINAVITIVNPELIILGGGMITGLPNFAQKTVNYTRQFSWAIAWNNTRISISQLDGRDVQIYGAADLARLALTE